MKYKQAINSIIVGACVAFLATLFQSLADFFSNHGTAIISGGVASFWDHIKNTRLI